MALLSRTKTLTPMFKRKLTLPNYGMPLDPTPLVHEFVQETHAKHLEPIAKIMIFFVIPPLSAYCFWHEYQHLVVHKQRRRWPKQYFINAGVNRWPNGDHKHSPMHHPFWNFTIHGYETDKYGNKLPEGQYVDE